MATLSPSGLYLPPTIPRQSPLSLSPDLLESLNALRLPPRGPASVFPQQAIGQQYSSINGPFMSEIGQVGRNAGGGIVDDIAAQTARSGVRGAISNSVNSSVLGKVATATRGEGGLIAGGKALKGIGRASLIPAAAAIGSTYLGRAVGGKPGAVLSATGQGAAAGSLLGWPGALAGGLLAGGYALTKGEGKKFNGAQQLSDLFGQVPLDDTDKEQLASLYHIYRQSLKADGTKYTDEEATGLVSQKTLGLIQEREDEKAQQRQQIISQALYSKYFTPVTSKMMDSAKMRYDTMQRLLPSLPESYRGMAELQNTQNYENSIRSANAYAAQSAIMPQFDAMKKHQAMVDQISQQINSIATSSMLQNMGIGGSSSGTSLQDQLTNQALTK